jgi:hypothetical protein
MPELLLSLPPQPDLLDESNRNLVTDQFDVQFAPDESERIPFRTRLATSKLGRLALGTLTAVGFSSAALAVEAAPAFADSSITATVVNPDHDGTHSVFDRTSPHLGDKTTEYLRYGDTVQLICGTTGDPVGRRGNDRWHLVKDLTRPEAGTTYTADHWLDTPNKANEPTPGERECGPGDSADGQDGATTSTPPTGNNAQPWQKSVFFSGTEVPWGSSVEPVADEDYGTNQWSGNSCDYSKTLQLVPDSAETLAGWSRGRIGVVYFLANAPERAANIHRIVLFDPGAQSDIVPRNPLHEPGCDANYDVNALLADWLQSNPANQLTVITGIKTEMKSNSNIASLPSTYAGLKKYYLANIHGQPFANQAQVCDYNGLSHEDALKGFSWVVKNPPSEPCAPPPAGFPLTAWNP